MTPDQILRDCFSPSQFYLAILPKDKLVSRKYKHLLLCSHVEICLKEDKSFAPWQRFDNLMYNFSFPFMTSSSSFGKFSLRLHIHQVLIIKCCLSVYYLLGQLASGYKQMPNLHDLGDRKLILCSVSFLFLELLTYPL